MCRLLDISSHSIRVKGCGRGQLSSRLDWKPVCVSRSEYKQTFFEPLVCPRSFFICMTLLWSICAWFCVCVYCLFGGLTAPTTLAQRGLWVMKKWQWWLPGNWLLWGGRKGSVPTETSSKWNESKKEAKCKTSDDKSSAEVNASEETWCVCRKTYGFLKVSELKSIYCILYMKHYKLLYLYLAMILMDTFGIFLGTFMYISTDLIDLGNPRRELKLKSN